MTKQVSILGNIKMYVTHRPTDNAKPAKAEIQWLKNDETDWLLHPILEIDFGEIEQDDIDYTRSFIFDLSDRSRYPQFNDGDVIRWRARTRSNLKKADGINYWWSDWSDYQEFRSYIPPELFIGVTDLYSYPLKVVFDTTPTSQQVLSLSVDVFANQTYETTNFFGDRVIISKGEKVYSKIFTDIPNNYELELNANDILLENGINYRIKGTVATNIGLTNQDEKTFDVVLDSKEMVIESSLEIDQGTASISLVPTVNIPTDVLDSEGYMIYELAPNVIFSVYRLNYNGTFTTIAENISNTGNTLITDPHVPLSNSMYRIVATDIDTGSKVYEDFYSEEIVDMPGILLQWDEPYRSNISIFNSDYNRFMVDDDRLFSFGSALHLPYNIKNSEDNNKDVEFVDYIGREESTAYYGTKIGQRITLSTDVDKEDKETIYKLRRLRDYRGDVYFRERSGIGYWGSVTVSMNIDYDSLVVPVSLTITKVSTDKI